MLRARVGTVGALLWAAVAACSSFGAAPDVGADAGSTADGAAPDGGSGPCVPGGCSAEVFATVQAGGGGLGLAVTADAIYASIEADAIYKFAKASPPPTPAKVDIPSVEYIAVADPKILYTTFGNNSVGAIDQTPFPGPVPAPTTLLGQPVGIAASPTHIYVSLYNSQKVVRITRDTKFVVTDFMSLTRGEGVAYDASTDTVFVANNGGGTIEQRPVSGAQSVLETGLDSPAGVAVDAEYVYFTEQTGGRVWRKRKPSAPRELIYDHQSSVAFPSGIAVDDAYVYWITHDTSEIWRHKK